MKYRQLKIQDTDCVAANACLNIEGKWIEGILLDEDGNVLTFPCEVKAGEAYIIEVADA